MVRAGGRAVSGVGRQASVVWRQCLQTCSGEPSREPACRIDRVIVRPAAQGHGDEKTRTLRVPKQASDVAASAEHDVICTVVSTSHARPWLIRAHGQGLQYQVGLRGTASLP